MKKFNAIIVFLQVNFARFVTGFGASGMGRVGVSWRRGYVCMFSLNKSRGAMRFVHSGAFSGCFQGLAFSGCIVLCHF